MKLSGHPTLSPELLLLVAAFVTCDAFKLHGESFHEKFSVSDMEGAASVAQLAYQQKLISTNTWKALSNVTCFLEAAHSAGLTWTESHAQHHIVLTANGLKSQLGAKGASVRGIGKVSSMGIEFLDQNKDDLVDESLGIATDLVTSWFQSGEPPSFEDTVTAAAELAIGAIGMYNPLLGAVAGIAFSLISGILFPGEPESPMEKMYKKIMDEVGIAIDRAQVKAQIADLTLELEAVIDELEWIPSLLGGISEKMEDAKMPTADQARTLLTYNIMIQHDLAKLSYKIQNSDYAKPDHSISANNLWSAGMFPLAEQLILLQSNLLIDIASHESIQNVDLAGTRILRNLRNWEKWIAENDYKAHLASADQTVKTLGWMVGDRRKGTHMDGLGEDSILGKWQKNACNVSGIDACEKMNCDQKVDWDCGDVEDIKIYKEEDKEKWSSSWCAGACYRWTAEDFYWQYLSPKLDKLLPKVKKMITTFAMKGFEKMGDGECAGTPSNKSVNVADVPACAKECHDEYGTDCSFFIYRASNKRCYYGYHSDTCAFRPNTDWKAYRRGIAGFEYMNPGKCTSTPYRDWTSVTNKEHCARNCRALHKCKFFAFRAEPERCILFETCDLTNADGFETYRRGTSHAEYMDQPPTVANLKHKFRGRCLGRHRSSFEATNGKLYEDRDRGMAHWDSDRYHSMVVQAWIRCFSRDSRTKWVSVWRTGEYLCFKHDSERSECAQYDDPDTRTWELKNWGPFN